jgi:hypothetical protein
MVTGVANHLTSLLLSIILIGLCVNYVRRGSYYRSLLQIISLRTSHLHLGHLQDRLFGTNLLLRLFSFNQISLFLTLGILTQVLHIMLDLNAFMSYSPYNGSDKLYIGDGKGLAIIHTSFGTTFPLKLHNMLHVPIISKPSLSISQLLADNVLYVEFNCDSCLVKALDSHQGSSSRY